MGTINILDTNMVNMIAAGEVIDRPASVVKELLENSIDAGAHKITVEIEDGGKKLIKITDDGSGMDAEDLAKAFVPHATSKIKSIEDLNKISTMGFRGEALASIGSIARVSIISRQKDAISANRVDIDCGLDQQIKPCSGSIGTTITVENLFYKLPARKKFLKTANTEITHIVEQFIRVGLVHCDIDFTLSHNGRNLYRLLANQSLLERLEILFSANIAQDVIPISSQEKSMTISGLVGKPLSAKNTNKYQYIFLNGRFIRDKFISHGLKESYRGLIEWDKYPIAFLFLQMPFDSYDVNVHPTKIEVRFDNANLVHSQIMAVIREALRRSDLTAQADLQKFNQTFAPKEAAADDDEHRKRIRQAVSDFFKDNKPQGTSQKSFDFKSSKSYSPNQFSQQSFAPNIPQMPQEFTSKVKQHFGIMQIHDSFIICQTDEGFEVIDQHALHERIMYEKMLAALNNQNLSSQKLLIPASFDVNNKQAEALANNMELFAKMGIDIESFGPSTYAVQSFTAMLGDVEPAGFVLGVLDLIIQNQSAPDMENLLHKILDMAACKAAIKAGQKLTEQEIQKLLDDRQIAERSSNCPHGRPTAISFKLDQLQKQFKRT